MHASSFTVMTQFLSFPRHNCSIYVYLSISGRILKDNLQCRNVREGNSEITSILGSASLLSSHRLLFFFYRKNNWLFLKLSGFLFCLCWSVIVTDELYVINHVWLGSLCSHGAVGALESQGMFCLPGNVSVCLSYFSSSCTLLLWICQTRNFPIQARFVSLQYWEVNFFLCVCS